MKKGVRLTGSILLSLILVIGSMAGCGKSGTPNSGTTTAGNSTSNTTNNSTSAIVDNNKLKKLTIYADMDPATAQSCKTLNDHEVFKELEKRTGVSVEWIHPAAGSGNEQFNLMIASGKYPDLIKNGWRTVAGGPAKYAQDGVILKLNTLIEKYAPDFMNIVKNNPVIKKDMVDAEGNMYFLPEVIITPENNLYKGAVIRTDWLQKLNLKVPANVDELYEVLKAFRDKDPNSNGKKDEWAMSGGGNFYSTGAHSVGNLAWAWDVSCGYYLKDGKVKFGPLEPQFQDVLKYLNKLYTEGLLDPDYILMDRSKLDAKVMDNKVGFCYHYQPTNFMTLMVPKQPDFKIAGIPYPKGPNGQNTVYDSSLITTVVDAGSIAITTACKQPEEAMKWLNYSFSKEGNLLFNFGIEGQSYKMVNGVPKYTDLILKNPEGLSPSVALGKWSMSICKWPIVQDVEYFRQYVVTDYSRDSIQTWAKSVSNTDPFKSIMPSTPKSAADSEKHTAIITELNTYIAEMCDKFILGKEPFEKYPDFVARIKAMKIDDAIKIQQAAYDKYNAIK